MANRTLNFHGAAFGEVPVQMNAHINGQLVFSGAVQPQSADHPDPVTPGMFDNSGILFSVVDSSLFPTGSELTYPMTLSVATGECVFLTVVYSNYMPTSDITRFSGSISGTTLTVSSVTSGTISVGMGVGVPGTTTGYGKIVSGSGTTWELDQSHTVPEGSLGAGKSIPGTPTDFSDCYPQGDARTNVQIDGVDQTPDRQPGQENGEWTWCINAGSTFECQLHVAPGLAP